MINLSHSASEKYTNCPYSYYLHYILKLREKGTGSPLYFGGAVDQGINDLLENRDVPRAKALFIAEWDKVKPNIENIKFSKADLDPSLLEDDEITGDIKLDSWKCLQKKGLLMIDAYMEQIIPDIKKVLAVQVPISIVNDEGHKLRGFVDFIAELNDGRVIIFDNKTSSVAYESDSVKVSPQLATYADALSEQYPNVDGCGFIVISKAIRKKKLPKVKIDVIIDKVAEETTRQTFEKYDNIINNIKKAKFDQDFNGCTTKFGKCPYFDFCRSGSLNNLKYEEDK